MCGVSVMLLNSPSRRDPPPGSEFMSPSNSPGQRLRWTAKAGTGCSVAASTASSRVNAAAEAAASSRVSAAAEAASSSKQQSQCYSRSSKQQ